MPIDIRNRLEEKDKDGILGKKLLQSNEISEVYRVKHVTRYCNANINISNPNSADAEVTIWVTTEKQPLLIDIVESKIVLKPDATYVRTNLIIGNNEAIFARSNISNCIIRVDGYENNLI